VELLENKIGFKLFCNKNIEIMIEFQLKFNIVQSKLMNQIVRFKLIIYHS
jgi:hypothetical protein